jgi:hypothetical protein
MSLCLIDEKIGNALHTVIPEVFYRGSIHAKNRFLLRECRNDGAVWLHFSKLRKLMGIQEKLFILLIMSCFFFSSAHAFVNNGKDWRQLTETTNISYTEANSIFDNSTGLLLDPSKTTVNGVDFTGNRWASAQEVADLFSSLPSLKMPGAIANVTQVDSIWAPASLLQPDRFLPTQSNYDQQQIIGVTRTLKASGFYAIGARIVDSKQLGSFDIASTALVIHLSDKDKYRGIWVYTPVVFTEQIPLGVWIFGTGLILLFEICRRKHKKFSVSKAK